MNRLRRLHAWLAKPHVIDPRSQAYCHSCNTLGPIDEGRHCWWCGELIPGLGAEVAWWQALVRAVQRAWKRLTR